MDMSATELERRKEKNHSLFLDSLKKIQWKSIDMVIAGNDIYTPALKKYIDAKKIVVIIPSPMAFSDKINPGGYRKITHRMKKNLVDVNTVVLSKKMKIMLRRFLPAKNYKIFIIPPGIDTKRFSAKKKLKSNDILYVGRMDKEKNVEALLMSLGMIRRPLNAKLIGTGSLLGELKISAKKIPNKRIYLAGLRKNVERYYNESKIFVLPSKYEAFGLVILEAMASNLPVIAFKPSKKILTASDEIILNGKNGYLVKDIKEMGEKIELLLNEKFLRLRMGANALATAQKYSWSKHAKKLLELV
ncbi:MAG: glycosyltransferase family 4 protein [Candidatus Moranbacteria bacterium]|nr:glycosyltransferase family 4 protein [Candidatus Moranbacteria bacterium]